MEQEKTMRLPTGRYVKILLKDIQPQDASNREVSILIKEPKEAYFHPPIGINHPKYWKLKQLSA